MATAKPRTGRQAPRRRWRRGASGATSWSLSCQLLAPSSVWATCGASLTSATRTEEVSGRMLLNHSHSGILHLKQAVQSPSDPGVCYCSHFSCSFHGAAGSGSRTQRGRQLLLLLAHSGGHGQHARRPMGTSAAKLKTISTGSV